MLRNKKKATHRKCFSMNLIKDLLLFEEYQPLSFDFLCFHFSECNPMPPPPVVKTRFLRKPSRRNSNFVIHTSSNMDSLCTHINSNLEYISMRATCKECLESGIESETKERIQKINEPISERYDNRAVLLALIDQVKRE